MWNNSISGANPKRFPVFGRIFVDIARTRFPVSFVSFTSTNWADSEFWTAEFGEMHAKVLQIAEIVAATSEFSELGPTVTPILLSTDSIQIQKNGS